jgi:hypothetical protein
LERILKLDDGNDGVAFDHVVRACGKVLTNSVGCLCLKQKEEQMAKESKRVKSEAGKAMHSSSKVTRSLAGEVLRQAQKGRKKAPKR